jgi:hypothetical protein
MNIWRGLPYIDVQPFKDDEWEGPTVFLTYSLPTRLSGTLKCLILSNLRIQNDIVMLTIPLCSI